MTLPSILPYMQINRRVKRTNDTSYHPLIRNCNRNNT